MGEMYHLINNEENLIEYGEPYGKGYRYIPLVTIPDIVRLGSIQRSMNYVMGGVYDLHNDMLCFRFKDDVTIIIDVAVLNKLCDGVAFMEFVDSKIDIGEVTGEKELFLKKFKDGFVIGRDFNQIDKMINRYMEKLD